MIARAQMYIGLPSGPFMISPSSFNVFSRNRNRRLMDVKEWCWDIKGQCFLQKWPAPRDYGELEVA